MLTWHYITRAAYDAASEADKSSDKLFFLSDTKEIYRGTESFTESVILYTTEPATKAVGKLYINATTLEGKIWNGSTWTTVIQPVVSTVDASNTVNPVSGKGIADFVAEQIANVTGSDGLVANVEYVAASNGLKVTMADGSTDTIPMSNVAADLVYDSTTGLLQVKNAAGTTIGTGINLDLERFVSEASYDHEAGVITLKFNDDQDPLTIDIGDLVDTYTAKNSETVALTVTGNEFVAEVIVSETAGNQLVATANGLYVAAQDISGKVDKVSGATAGDIALLTAEGGLSDSGVTVGGAALSGESASVLATEAAVAAVRTALEATIATKMAKVGTGHEGEVIVADGTGDASASGVKIGGAAISANPDAATLATEKGVTDYVAGYAVAKTNVVAAGSMATTVAAASDEKVTSEKAIVEAMTWKTTV